jgi:hypothetical protein
VNGNSWEAGKPCPVAYNAGFIWSDADERCVDCPADERCVDCPARPAGAQWTYGCNFKCSSGLFGDDLGVCYDLGVCVTCRAYHELKRTRLPPRASWPNETTSCGDVSWVCDGNSYKSLEANKPGYNPGCCPIEPPLGSIKNAISQDSCGFQCVTGFQWDDDLMACVWGGWGGGGAPAISGMTIWNLTYQERFSGCSLNATWKEIRRESRYETGGLGKMMKVDEYQVRVSVSVYICMRERGSEREREGERTSERASARSLNQDFQEQKCSSAALVPLAIPRKPWPCTFSMLPTLLGRRCAAADGHGPKTRT